MSNQYGFEITDDGLVILRPKPTDPFASFVETHLGGHPPEITMSPEFVQQMGADAKAWQDTTRDREWERQRENPTPTRRARYKINVDPDGVERRWFVENIEDD